MTKKTEIVAVLPGRHRCGGDLCPGLAWPASAEVPHPATCLADYERPYWPGPAALARSAAGLTYAELEAEIAAAVESVVRQHNALNKRAGLRIRMLRVGQHLTRCQAAAAMGVTVMELAAIEDGRHVDEPTRAKVIAWVKRLEDK